jgi:hypothetical protein
MLQSTPRQRWRWQMPTGPPVVRLQLHLGSGSSSLGNVGQVVAAFGDLQEGRDGIARAEDATPVDNCLALRAELEQVEEQLKWIPRHRSRGAVQGDMTVLKAQRNWLTSKACTDLTFEASREFCQRYSTLAAEYASGQEAEKYEAKIAQLGADLATARPGPACLRK